MANPKVRFHDLASNEIIDGEMTNEELAQLNADITAAEAKANAEANQLALKIAAYKKLGLSADEIEAILK